LRCVRNFQRPYLSLIAVATLLAGCETHLTVDLTDGPTDGAQEVVLDIDSITLLAEDNSTVTLAIDDPGPVDLLAFRNGQALRLIDDESVSPDTFVGIALNFASTGSFVTLEDGTEATINVPTTRTFADIDLVLGEFESESLVIDLNLRFSLADTGSGDFDLDPVVRAVRPSEAGTITGIVTAAIVESTACRAGRPIGTGVAVYAFSGSNVTPADYVGQATLVAADDVEPDTASGGYRYELHFLPAGSYTLALTCQADADDPATDDAVTFTASGNASVSATGTVQFNFF
jgi:hypothetical protein